ncbi:hypothetical protein WMY93_027041 [Mugilogobius chulae]|uniref:P2X purinoreceptor 7 intracellular domain-containing protein n=1 Tax=Mugilogobius chulae TaxID=88201 RepID=A0AAW0MWH2_9GOBI
MESDSENSIATEHSFDVEDFSPPVSPDAADDSELNPLPYQFELLAQEMSELGATGGAEAAEPEIAGARTGAVSEWCTCGHCSSLSPVENICCRETPKVVRRCEQVGGMACITAHPGFEPVALNPYVLQAVYATYVQLFGEMQETIINSCYRHLAYRNFVRWCWGYLGQHVRVVIPSCVVPASGRNIQKMGI